MGTAKNEQVSELVEFAEELFELDRLTKSRILKKANWDTSLLRKTRNLAEKRANNKIEKLKAKHKERHRFSHHALSWVLDGAEQQARLRADCEDDDVLKPMIEQVDFWVSLARVAKEASADAIDRELNEI